MQFLNTTLEGAFLIRLTPFTDTRGWFARTYCKNEFAAIGYDGEWVQLNHSVTTTPGTIRGMHYQLPPFAEVKLVRCIAGAVFDVIVDLRKNSPGFLQWYGVELSAKNKQMLYIPAGFAHGFQALEPDSELIYHHSNFYTPGAEGGIRFDDPLIGIEWPLPPALVSDRDSQHPFLTQSFNGI